MICWKCNKEIDLDEVYRTTECPECHSYLHCCKGCRFYAPGNHFDCREDVDEVITDKEKANFCDYFSPVKEKSGKADNSKNKASEAKNAFNALFGEIICL